MPGNYSVRMRKINQPSSNRRVVATPSSLLPLHKNEKETDPGLLGNLFYIFCAHFNENKLGVPPKVGVSWEVRGVVATQESFFF